MARDVSLDRAVVDLLSKLGWSGLFQVQFIRPVTRSYVIDLNPRMYGSLALVIAARVISPAVWVDPSSGGRHR